MVPTMRPSAASTYLRPVKVRAMSWASMTSAEPERIDGPLCRISNCEKTDRNKLSEKRYLSGVSGAYG